MKKRNARVALTANAVLFATLCVLPGVSGATDDAAARAARKAELQAQLARIQAELAALEEADGGDAGKTAAAPASVEPSTTVVTTAEDGEITTLGAVEVHGEYSGTGLGVRPAGRTISTARPLEDSRSFTVKEALEDTPGIFVKQGNGPRDMLISIRGSGAKQAFGLRNIKVYEDGFPVTQSDGLARTDNQDPHAYGEIDVIRGPSSSLYDNYAIGGVINYRTRKGRDIDGLEVGTDFGSENYWNHYVTLGGTYHDLEYSLFGSAIRADGWYDNSEFDTSTENFIATWAPDADHALTVKLVNNDIDAQVPSRLSKNQLAINPQDAGTASLVRPGLAALTVPTEQLAQGRADRRTIAGARYEQTFGENTDWRVMGVFDLKDINQTFGTITDNENPNWQFSTDVTHRSTLFGLEATHFAGLFFNHMEQEGITYFNLGDFAGTRGAVQSANRGTHQNLGGRVREELVLNEQWKLVAGVGVERSSVEAEFRNRIAAESFRIINVDREFTNIAPEGAIIWTPVDTLAVHARVGTGYGIPGIGNLTTGADGLPGNNTALEPQYVIGTELGVDWAPFDGLSLNVTGYYEWFENEFISQSPGIAGRSNFTSNAPAAEHRGIELAAYWAFLDGFRASAAYTFNDHVYTDYTEVIGTTSFDRNGNEIPGVERHILNARLGYDHPAGALRGLGGWFEVNALDDFWINNSNTLEAPGYAVFNANLHYTRDVRGTLLEKFTAYLELQNLTDRDYVASATVVADAIGDTAATLRNKQAFFAGQERSIFAGVKLSF